MIVRVWRGYAPSSKPLAYVEHFRGKVLPALQRITGFRGASLLRHDRDEEVEFLVLTRWTSMAAIRAFAGEDVGKAVVESEAVAALAGYDRTVKHYEVVEEEWGAERDPEQSSAAGEGGVSSGIHVQLGYPRTSPILGAKAAVPVSGNAHGPSAGEIGTGFPNECRRVTRSIVDGQKEEKSEC